jgi:hypothetical protein
MFAMSADQARRAIESTEGISIQSWHFDREGTGWVCFVRKEREWLIEKEMWFDSGMEQGREGAVKGNVANEQEKKDKQLRTWRFRLEGY